jgi:RecJ-like exonuclease
MVVAARGGGFKLSDYDSLIDDLNEVPEEADELIICDLGTDPKKLPVFVSTLQRVAKKMKVLYIDHHFLTSEAKRRIRDSGVKLIHNVNECSGMLTYRTFKESLPEGAKLPALYAAVTDYMDNSPMARKMMERYDRHYVLFEATLLSHSIAQNGDDRQFLEKLVRELSKMKMPHSIDEVPKLALLQAEKMERLAAEVRNLASRLKNVAYMRTDQHSTGSVAKLLLGAIDVNVGIAFREKRKRWFEVSLRGTSESKAHLGQLVIKAALKHGGNGGGHKRAAGCTIPKEKMKTFLEEIDGSL